MRSPYGSTVLSMLANFSSDVLGAFSDSQGRHVNTLRDALHW